MTENSLLQGIKLFYNSNYPEAVSILNKLYKENNDIEAGYHMALCYTQMKDFDSALDIFDKISKHIDNPLRIMQMHIIVSYIYVVREMYDLAEFELQEAIKLGIENVQIYSSLGYIHYKKNEVDLAITNLEKAIDLDPDNANARNSLGFILADSDKNLERGIIEIKYAVDIDGNNAAYLDSLGWAYLKKKDILNARRFLTRAFEIAPNNEDIKRHIKELEELAPQPGKSKSLK